MEKCRLDMVKTQMSDCFLKTNFVLCLVEVPHPHLMDCWIRFPNYFSSVKNLLGTSKKNKTSFTEWIILAKVWLVGTGGSIGNPSLLVSSSPTWPAYGPLLGAQFEKYCSLWHRDFQPRGLQTTDHLWTSDANNFMTSLSRNFFF